MVELGLVAALMAATSWAALAAGWTQGDGNAVAIAGVLAVAAAAILGSIHAHRILAALVTPFVVAVAVVPATLAILPSVPRETLGAVEGCTICAQWSPASGPRRDGISSSV